MSNIQKLLNEEIETQVLDLHGLEPGSEEKQRAIDGIAKLVEVQNKRDNLYQNLRLVLDAAGVILPLAAACYWTNRGFKFEDTGYQSSPTLKELYRKVTRFLR